MTGSFFGESSAMRVWARYSGFSIDESGAHARVTIYMLADVIADHWRFMYRYGVHNGYEVLFFCLGLRTVYFWNLLFPIVTLNFFMFQCIIENFRENLAQGI